ncbi:hypothetical protein [Streptomyces sp. IB2014 016-6]|uniref:hypothetical protein n=1 Tax=Streptomyces sp. IB2014 016-6 TaxID=2517818 RepID=UPI0011CC6A8C|nr:hypothetical protein [Streptomyces sp. IB2014 016-6]TXL91598.1 hypothetical protein EW053_04530 [Streptomyces sp. IB2014 016-6]
MADSEDQAMKTLARHLSQAYTVLATLCLNLPVPVTLPTGAVSNLEVVQAVRRMMEITEDQPMPEEQQASLFAACSFWLGALDLYGVLTREFHTARAHSAAANLIMCDDTMHDLIVWLADTQK